MIAVRMKSTRSKDNRAFSFVIVLKKGTIIDGRKMSVNERLERGFRVIETFELVAIVVLRLAIDNVASIGLRRTNVSPFSSISIVDLPEYQENP